MCVTEVSGEVCVGVGRYVAHLYLQHLQEPSSDLKSIMVYYYFMD